MNKVILVGRLTRNPDVRYTTGENSFCVANYTLAVDRRYKKAGDADADFIRCTVFGKGAEFAEKYLKQGTKIGVTGRITTGSYENKEGVRVYTTEVTVEEQEFVESKASASANAGFNRNVETAIKPDEDGFTSIAQGVTDDIPF